MTLKIRPVTAFDASGIHEIYRPIVLDTAISFELEVPSVAEVSERLRTTLQTHPWLVCEADGGLVAGYAYANRIKTREAYQWSAEVSAYTRPDFQRRGIARALYTALFRILVHQGFVNAFAGIALPNDASVALHERVGFTPVGVLRGIGYKLDDWQDVGWWEMSLRPSPRAPSPPRRFEEVANETAVLEALAAGQDLLAASG
jgi:L-amino acid N-acyltransferase YncA